MTHQSGKAQGLPAVKPDKMIGTGDAALMLRQVYDSPITHTAVRRWVKSGQLPVKHEILPGGTMRISSASLQAHIDGLKAEQGGRG